MHALTGAIRACHAKTRSKKDEREYGGRVRRVRARGAARGGPGPRARAWAGRQAIFFGRRLQRPEDSLQPADPRFGATCEAKGLMPDPLAQLFSGEESRCTIMPEQALVRTIAPKTSPAGKPLFSTTGPDHVQAPRQQSLLPCDEHGEDSHAPAGALSRFPALPRSYAVRLGRPAPLMRPHQSSRFPPLRPRMFPPPDLRVKKGC